MNYLLRKRLSSALAATLVIGATSSSFAQTTGFSVDQFDPSERGSDWFANESLDLRGNFRPAIGVVGDWGYRPLVETDANGNVLHSIVLNQVLVHPGASLVMWDRLRLGLDVPVQVFANGTTAVADGVTYPAPAHATSMGDIRVGLDVRLFGTYGEAITGAIGAQVYLPTGDPASYSGDGSVRLAPRAMVAGEIGVFVYAVKLGTMIRGLNESIDGAQVGTNIFFGASDGIRVLNKKLVVGPEIFGSSVVTNGAFFSTRATPVEALFGAHYTVAEDWRLGAGVAKGLSVGYGTPVVRGVISFEWAPAVPPPDRDHDGILDQDDACPDVPGIRTDDPKTNGCPPPPSDRDHDGILDKEDACPDVPGVKTDDQQTNGCGDRDHDGVFDMDDACPDVPGVETADPKTNGCPAPEDRDHDGVLDKDDACPDVPGIKTDDPKTNGCPDPDRDKDGIPNAQDACPDEPGKPDPDPKKNGCPKAFVQAGQIMILEQIKFRTGSAQIEGKESEEVLQAVLAVLTKHPEIKKVRVEGHTDNRGGAAMNKKLSADRAASVVSWLVAHDIDVGAALTSQGFGQDRPIDSNKTETGRKNNRRVEFHIEN